MNRMEDMVRLLARGEIARVQNQPLDNSQVVSPIPPNATQVVYKRLSGFDLRFWGSYQELKESGAWLYYKRQGSAPNIRCIMQFITTDGPREIQMAPGQLFRGNFTNVMVKLYTVATDSANFPGSASSAPNVPIVLIVGKNNAVDYEEFIQLSGNQSAPVQLGGNPNFSINTATLPTNQSGGTAWFVRGFTKCRFIITRNSGDGTNFDGVNLDLYVAYSFDDGADNNGIYPVSGATIQPNTTWQPLFGKTIAMTAPLAGKVDSRTFDVDTTGLDWVTFYIVNTGTSDATKYKFIAYGVA